MAARRYQCKCGTWVLRELVGHRAALTAVVDARPLPAGHATALREPNRLAWHLHTLRNGDLELRWLHPADHPPDCDSDVIEHRCPQQTDLFAA